MPYRCCCFGWTVTSSTASCLLVLFAVWLFCFVRHFMFGAPPTRLSFLSLGFAVVVLVSCYFSSGFYLFVYLFFLSYFLLFLLFLVFSLLRVSHLCVFPCLRFACVGCLFMHIIRTVDTGRWIRANGTVFSSLSVIRMRLWKSDETVPDLFLIVLHLCGHLHVLHA